MFSPLRFLTLLLLLGLSMCFARTAAASHAIGGSITYTSLGGNSYRVRADFTRDCFTVVAPSVFNLTCTTSCGTTALTALLALVGQPVIGMPYTSSLQPRAVCPLATGAPSNALPNYAAYRYEGNVTLTPNQWILSVEESSRPLIANAIAGNLRLEATLDNRGRTNNSVQFSSLPTIFFPFNRPNLTHIGAYDADGDSLTYSLEQPLSGCGTYEAYTPYPTTTCTVTIDPRCIRRIIGCAGMPTMYSQLLPIAVANDTLFENGSTVRPPCPTTAIVNVTAQPRFDFVPALGAFSFMPGRYVPTPAANGDNKYIVTVKVREWRRENGVLVIVGTTRRDMLWEVYDSGNNTLPRLSPTVMVQNGTQSTSRPLTAAIAASAGEPVSVTFSATNPGSALPLAFTLEQNTIPGAVIQPGSVAGTARLTFTPPLSMPRGTYNVSLSVTDDAGPLRNLITVPVTFYVSPAVLATRRASAPAIAAYPTPFSQAVQFQLPKAGVQALTVFDQLGRVIAHLQSRPDGNVHWTPGPAVPAGLCSARSADGQLVVRLLRSAAQ